MLISTWEEWYLILYEFIKFNLRLSSLHIKAILTTFDEKNLLTVSGLESGIRGCKPKNTGSNPGSGNNFSPYRVNSVIQTDFPGKTKMTNNSCTQNSIS